MQALRRLSFLAPVVVAVAVAGCSKSSEAPKTYTTAGEITAIAPDKSSAGIKHEDIPGYMKAMTMTFATKATSQLDGLKVGDKVSLTFEGDAKHTLVEIKKK